MRPHWKWCGSDSIRAGTRAALIKRSTTKSKEKVGPSVKRPSGRRRKRKKHNQTKRKKLANRFPHSLDCVCVCVCVELRAAGQGFPQSRNPILIGPLMAVWQRDLRVAAQRRAGQILWFAARPNCILISDTWERRTERDRETRIRGCRFVIDVVRKKTRNGEQQRTRRTLNSKAPRAFTRNLPVCQHQFRKKNLFLYFLYHVLSSRTGFYWVSQDFTEFRWDFFRISTRFHKFRIGFLLFGGGTFLRCSLGAATGSIHRTSETKWGKIVSGWEKKWLGRNRKETSRVTRTATVSFGFAEFSFCPSLDPFLFISEATPGLRLVFHAPKLPRSSFHPQFFAVFRRVILHVSVR